MSAKFLPSFIAPLALAFVVTASAADTLVLRSGKSLEGSFVGASGDIVYLRVEGEIKQHSLGEVSSIRFDKDREARRGLDPGDRSAGRAVIVGAGAVITVAFSTRLLTGNLREGQVFKSKLGNPSIAATRCWRRQVGTFTEKSRSTNRDRQVWC